jgi:hypothetical protein
MDLKETGWEITGWICQEENRILWQAFVNKMMNFRAPNNAVNF